VFTPDKITLKYIDMPPKIVLEIDVNIEMPLEQKKSFGLSPKARR
jgi:hypothetical protein